MREGALGGGGTNDRSLWEGQENSSVWGPAEFEKSGFWALLGIVATHRPAGRHGLTQGASCLMRS